MLNIMMNLIIILILLMAWISILLEAIKLIKIKK